MKKPLNKVGFKFSWETEQTEQQVEHINTTIENVPTAFNELAQRIDNCKNLITSSTFAKMRKAEKASVINTYDFYVSLYTEYTLKAIS